MSAACPSRGVSTTTGHLAPRSFAAPTGSTSSWMCAPISCVCSTYDVLVIRRGVLAALLLALGVLVLPADAATRTVHLTANGPSPARLALTRGDRVQFVNDDTVPHQVVSGSNWQFDSGPLPPGATSNESQVFTAPGTYRYTDNRGIVVFPQSFAGSLVLPKPKPRPSSSPTPTPQSTVTPTPSAVVTNPPPGTATPSAAPTGSPTSLPTATPTESPLPSASPTGPTPAPEVRYGDQRALVQGSPHRYGLPALLGLVGIGGVGSLLGRYLLTLAPRRTDED